MLYRARMAAIEAPDDNGIVRHSALGQQVASAIRRDIILGTVAAGTVLPQEKLCERYDVSRIPVRDALLALANEGFVVPNRRGQMVVSRFSHDDMLDTFKINAFLSGLAAARAAEVADSDDMDELDRLVSQGDKLDAIQDRDRISDWAWAFHRRVNRSTRSARLLATLRATTVPLIHQDFMRDIRGWWEVSQDEHRDIAAAIRSRDAERARKLMSAHFDHAGDALARCLSERDTAVGLADVAPIGSSGSPSDQGNVGSA